MIIKEKNIKNSIVEKALELFIRYGINAVSTEDISLHSGISKRTLYTHFKSKALLIQDVILYHTELIRSQSDRIHLAHTSAVEEFVALWNYASGVVLASNPNFLRDLSRHYPVSWLVLTQFKSAYRKDFLVTNLQRGIAQQVYLADIDVEVISLLWLKVMGLNFEEIKSGSELRTHFLRGLVTEKGTEIINYQCYK